jgi:hypothetical protein
MTASKKEKTKKKRNSWRKKIWQANPNESPKSELIF